MESLTELTAFEPVEFERWLEGRLRAHYEAGGIDAFQASDFRRWGVAISESHLDSFVGVYRLLPPRAQRAFQHGLERLIRHAQPGRFPAAAMTDAVLLVGLVEAHSVFPVFAPVFGAGPWGEIQPSLIYDSLAVLLTFDRSGDAYSAARGLATSKNFPDEYVFDAYLVMVRSRPSLWARDLAMLRERFARVRHKYDEIGSKDSRRQLEKREDDFIAWLVRAVPLSDFSESLKTLELVPAATQELDSTDRWLVKRLFDDGPLSLEYAQDDNHIFLVDRAAPSRRANLLNSDELAVFCIDQNLIRTASRPRSSVVEKFLSIAGWKRPTHRTSSKGSRDPQ